MSDEVTETETPLPPRQSWAKKKPGRPARKTAAAAGPSFTEDQFSRLLAVMAATAKPDGAFDLAALKEVLATTSLQTAQAMQKAMKPENQEHPGKSAMSYPEGDVARPRPVLPFEFWYNNYPCHMFPETEHWRELELMVGVTPGRFTTIRRDGSLMHVDVRAERDANQTVTKLFVEFPIAREEKGLIPPKAVVLYQLLHPEHPKRAFVQAMQEYLLMMLGTEDEPLPVPVGA